MKATLVSLCPTDAAREAGRPALTPELLAATGARYSRNNEGLDAIVAKIDPNRLDASVDSIFRMIDYGHQSIADMVPVAIFMDGISMWLAYHVWSLASVAGGQESSTRYINISEALLPDPADIGIPQPLRGEWSERMHSAFYWYSELLEAWTRVFEEYPEEERARLMPPLGGMAPERRAKVEARIRRNYAFDRARYLLPSAVRTNVMRVMSARAWAALCTNLSAQPLPEAVELAGKLRAELALVAPHLLRHADATADASSGIWRELGERMALAASPDYRDIDNNYEFLRGDAGAKLEVFTPAGVGGAELAAALAFHTNRYAWQGSALARTSVRFSWDAVTFAEMRDLNRHRTGSKHSNLVPRGFYTPHDQVPDPDIVHDDSLLINLTMMDEIGVETTRKARELLATGDPTYIYWTLLGTEFDFEHVTTADKFIYEAELRTGTGAHFRYARHFHDMLALWYERFPETRGKILEGSAEPE